MSSYVAKASIGLAGVMRKVGSSLDNLGKKIEVTKYTEKLVPSTRFVAVNGIGPSVSPMSFVAPSASVVGDVDIGKESSVWYGAVIRGDVNKVTIGYQSSIGDRAVVHVAAIQNNFPTHIGNHVTIGAGAIVHAATLHDSVIVGEMAQILDGSVIETNSVIAPASIVPPGTKVPSGELWAGAPATKVRALTAEEITSIKKRSSDIVLLAAAHSIENAKSYEKLLEEKELEEIEYFYEDEDDTPFKDIDESRDVLGQGAPGRIFRSSLTHPEEAMKKQNSEK